MQRNLGAFSRISRSLLAVAFRVLLWAFQQPWGLLGLPLIASAAAGWCPLCPKPSGDDGD